MTLAARNMRTTAMRPGRLVMKFLESVTEL
jgi:hypothetical protein